MQLVDLHTHQTEGTDAIRIRNIFAQDLTPNEPGFFFSAGLHPWHIEKVKPERCLLQIEQAVRSKNMLAVGECGLDRSIPIDFALQEWCFKQQVSIAEDHRKALIIHCVRAYPDLIKHKKAGNSDLPWIIHGYNGNPETTMSLIRHRFYFSVGERLLNDKAKHDILRVIPPDRLFLETDESKVSIADIYLIAAQILMIDENQLVQIIANNFKNIFGEIN